MASAIYMCGMIMDFDVDRYLRGAMASTLALALLSSGCTTLLPAPVKLGETEISRTEVDKPRMMTEQIGDYEVSASSDSDEHDPTNRELSGQARSVERTYQRCVQRVELQFDEKWRQEYSALGYALDGTGAVAFGLLGAGGVTAGIVNSDDDGATPNLVVGGVSLLAAAAFGYSIYAALRDSGDVETRRTTRKQWVDASGCDAPTPAPSATSD